MFDNPLLELLRSSLGAFVKDLEPSSLELSLWDGSLTLRNLELNPRGIEAALTGFSVIGGSLGLVTCKCPWRSLGSEPVLLRVEGLHASR